jgi:hypothetical protein
MEGFLWLKLVEYRLKSMEIFYQMDVLICFDMVLAWKIDKKCRVIKHGVLEKPPCSIDFPITVKDIQVESSMDRVPS